MIGSRASSACERLAERVLGVAGAPAPDVAGSPAPDLAGSPAPDLVARRVFDTLGAVAVGARLLYGSAGAPRGLGLPETAGALCAAARCTEVDDIERRSCVTPGSVAVPVALAVASERGASGPAVLAGVAAGYEAMVAVGEAIDGARVLYRGVWPSYLAAPLAAAATAARVLELDEARFVDALSIAAARCAGSVGRPARELTSRWFLYGRAAADGVAAALAAERGVAGDPALLEAVLGAHAQGPAREIPIAVDVPAVARVDVKPFCTARQAQAAVEAALGAWAEIAGDPREVDAIEVGVPEAYRGMVDQPGPRDRITSIMSAQYQIAAALTEPRLLYDVARVEPGLDAAGTALIDATTVVADPELTPLFPGVWPARVSIRLRDGREVTRQVSDPDGAGDCGPGWDWLERKHAALGSFGDDLNDLNDLNELADGCRALQAGAPARSLLDRIRLNNQSAHNGGT